MIDIHSHIIPYVDDGARDEFDSLKMLQDEVKNGVDTIILTPHFFLGTYDGNIELIKEQYERLKVQCEENNLSIKLILGMEIMYTEQLDLIEKLNKKELLTLGDSNLVLLEFDYDNPPRESINDIVFKFKLSGYRVVIAHVERYSFLDIESVYELKNEGALIQVNASSLVGSEGRERQKYCQKLIKYGFVDFIASDIHYFRNNHLGEVYKKYGFIIDESLNLLRI